LALRSDERREAREVRGRIGEAEDVVRFGNAGGLHLCRKVAGVIDDSVGAELLDPLRGFWPRGRCDDAQAREFLGELNRDRAYAARSTDQQHTLTAVRA